MTTPKSIGEADLHAYVDGELEERGRAEVETWLADHPEDAARIRAFREQKAALHALYDGVLSEPLPARIELALSRRPKQRAALWTRVAAGLLLFLAGGLAGWGLHGQQVQRMAADDGFVRQAVGAHVVYSAEVRHPVEVGADEEAHLVAWLSKRLGAPVRAPRLTSAGFDLVGGRLLPDGGAPAAQFMYEDTAGRRLTLYARTDRRDGDTAFRFLSDQGELAFYWIDGPLAYALIGKLSRDDLLPLARIVYEDLQVR